MSCPRTAQFFYLDALQHRRAVKPVALFYFSKNIQSLTYIGIVFHHYMLMVFTARRYASAVYAVVVCLSVSVCLSHSGIVSKRQNVRSRK